MIAAFGQGTDKIVHVSKASHCLSITPPALYLHQPTACTTMAMASRSGKRPHCDSIDSDSPVPTKKYKQATSFASDTSTTSTATDTAPSIELDYSSPQTPFCIDTLMPAFKNVQYDRPAYRSISPQPPSPRSH
ncbi:hypothetical protein FHETE_2336 [Fusarium heterosporum]|uniref:Uncharacterized protein n=1 Tax=Fusarium heterosporum TaxID=42747 RepID=A0A8H5WXQ5_FUSHE|nr:hypothetical protein FHETE_2336 [Fusarium heterosporum]